MMVRDLRSMDTSNVKWFFERDRIKDCIPRLSLFWSLLIDFTLAPMGFCVTSSIFFVLIMNAIGSVGFLAHQVQQFSDSTAEFTTSIWKLHHNQWSKLRHNVL